MLKKIPKFYFQKTSPAEGGIIIARTLKNLMNNVFEEFDAQAKKN
jgi:hypothetical protein